MKISNLMNINQVKESIKLAKLEIKAWTRFKKDSEKILKKLKKQK